MPSIFTLIIGGGVDLFCTEELKKKVEECHMKGLCLERSKSSETLPGSSMEAHAEAVEAITASTSRILQKAALSNERNVSTYWIHCYFL